MFTDLYIKMCKAATEIQELKFFKESNGEKYYKIKVNDWYERYGDLFIADREIMYQREFKHSKDLPITWLPDFGQLLEINSRGVICESHSLLFFCNWLEDKVKEDHSFILKHQTKEELGIFWINETCYGKTWSVDQWIPT